VKAGRLARRQALIINTPLAKAAADIHVFFLGAPRPGKRDETASEGGGREEGGGGDEG